MESAGPEHRLAEERSARQGVWVVIAAYGEESSVGGVVRGLREAGWGNVVVVDDGSPDRTGSEAAAGGAHVLRHAVNLGQGAALQTGIVYALARGARVVVTFDADGQHRAEDLSSLVGPVLAGECDVVMGSRFRGGTVGMPAMKRMVLWLAVAFTRLTTGMAVTDAHNGLRALSQSAAERIRIRQNGMAHASELIEEIGRHRLRWMEVPVTIVYSAYSIGKGQRLSNSLRIVSDLVAGRIEK